MSSVQLGSLLHLAQSSLTSELMLLGVHLDVVLREAKTPMLGKESAVSTFQNVQVRIGEFRILIKVKRTIILADVFSHDGGSVGGVLAVKYQGGLRLGG